MKTKAPFPSNMGKMHWGDFILINQLGSMPNYDDNCDDTFSFAFAAVSVNESLDSLTINYTILISCPPCVHLTWAFSPHIHLTWVFSPFSPHVGMRCTQGDFGGWYVELSPPPHKVTSMAILTLHGDSHLAFTLYAPLHVKIISPKSHEATSIPSIKYLLRATNKLCTVSKCVEVYEESHTSV